MENRIKHILHINAVANTGSTGRICEEIGSLASSLGWKSTIAYGRRANDSESELIKIGNNFDVYEHGLETRLFDNHCFASRRATKSLIQKIKQIKPSIIHLHNLHGYYLNIPILFDYLSIANIPIVWTLHDCWSFTGHCAHFDYIGCDKWKTQCYQCPQKREYPASFFLDHSSSNYKIKKQLFNQVKNMTIVPVSQWLGTMVQQSFLNRYPVHVIQNGIDLDVFLPQSNVKQIKKNYGIDGKFLILGVASTWTNRKGLYDFIALNQRLTNDCRIVLVGLKKKQIQELPKRVIGIERTESVQALVELYSAANLFINPTWEDTFPTTNLESLACGTPVATYRTGGSIESISEYTGFIVEKGNIDALCNVINVVKQKGKMFYFNNCRKRAISLYNKTDRFNEYMNLFNQLVI